MINTLLNRILWPFGARLTKLETYEYLVNLQERHLRATRTITDLFLEAAIARHDPFQFIQIGANDGVRFDGLYDVVTTANCRGVVVEPISIYFQKLLTNYKNYPDVIPVNVAVHKSLKKAAIYHVNPTMLDRHPDWASGIGSLDPEHYKRVGLLCDDLLVENVQCMHLMELISKFGLEGVNYIQIDTEGYDSEIISMIDFQVVHPTLIRFEHIHLNSEESRKTNAILTDHGFQLFSVSGDTVAWNTSAT